MYEGRNIKNTTARGSLPSEIYPLTVWPARPLPGPEDAFDDTVSGSPAVRKSHPNPQGRAEDGRDTQIVRGTIERK